MDDTLRTFGAALGALDLELDWELLGQSYCEGDGATFFDDELREHTLDTGLRFAEDVAQALEERPGRSVYLGADVAELPVILSEHLLLGRRVEWLNLEGPATSELRRALAVVSAKVGVELPAPSARALATIEPASCDHLWMVSVLTDPDAFPALHDALYQRTDGPLATGRGVLAEDRARADALVEEWLDRAAPSAVLATSDEERRVIAPIVARRGWKLSFARGGRTTAIVGDRVRLGTLTHGGGA